MQINLYAILLHFRPLAERLVGRTGYPSGGPCKHQHAVAKKFNLTASNLLPYFNGEGRYLHALIALGQDRVGDKSFYAGMKEIMQGSTPIDSTEMQNDANRGEQISDVLEDEGAQNLDLMLSVMEEKDKLKQDVLTLGNAFIEDFQERITQVDTQYLTGLK